MSDEVEHPVAYYRNEHGKLQTIEAKDLWQPKVLEIARLNFLSDIDEQYRLHPRTSNVIRPHFYLKGPQGPRVLVGERDPTHDARVAAISLRLNDLGDDWR